MKSMDQNKQSERLAIVLRYQGALAVESELAEIANKEGDEAIMKIAEHLSAAQVAQVTSEADIVKPSLLHTAVSPQQIRGVFRRVGVRWGAAEQVDCDEYTLGVFQDELQQFFCAFILLNEDESRRKKLLNAILEEQHGVDSLAFSVIQEKDFSEFMATGGGTVEFGDWREVLGILRAHFPEKWEQFVRVATRRQYEEFVHQMAAEIYAVAVVEGAVEQKESEKSDDLFTSLP